MATFTVVGTVLGANGYVNVHIGDSWTLTIVTDGFLGVCTVANGHLLSITGSLIISSYDITLTSGYPAFPTFDSRTNALNGETNGLSSITGFLTGLFDYNPISWTVEDESAGASGSIAAPCPKNAQGV